MRLVLLVLALCVLAPLTAAQSDSTAAVVRLELTDGSVLVGTVVREDAGGLVFRTASGAEIAVPAAQIRRRSAFEGRVEGGRAVRFDPNRSRLFFAPTARPLDGGSGYFAVYELVAPFLAYGVTDRVSVAAGTPLVPGLIGEVFYGAARATVLDTPGASVAAGALVVGVSDLFADDCPDGADCGGSGVEVAAIPFAVGTLGSAERAVTVGLGVPIGGGEGVAGGLVLLGGELQVSNSVKLLSENYLFVGPNEVYYDDGDGSGETVTETEVHSVLSGGVRFFGERLAADVGAFFSPEAGLSDFIPWIGFSYAFGR